MGLLSEPSPVCDAWCCSYCPEPRGDVAGSRDQAHSILHPLAGVLRALCSKPEQERMLSRWLGQLSADQFASRCVRPVMRHVDFVVPQLVRVKGQTLRSAAICFDREHQHLLQCRAETYGMRFASVASLGE